MRSSSRRVIVSLFDHSGAWSKPYRDAGYTVHQVDIKHGQNVMDLDSDWLESIGPVHGILAAPPCTDFAGSGAQYWPAKDADGRTAASLALVYHTLWLVKLANPKWWAMENPVGRLNKLVPGLHRFGPWYWQPWWYGDAYTKKTGLWGRFTPPPKSNAVAPVRVCSQGSWIQKLGGKSDRTKELRSVTPSGFAVAFFKQNQ